MTVSRSPMQAFSINAGVGRSTCDEVPSSLLIQSPKGYPVTLSVNGSDVTIGSTVIFSMDENGLRLAVIDGSATLPNGMVIQPGFHIDAILDENGSISDWQGVRPVPMDGLESFDVFESLDINTMSYTVSVPDIPVEIVMVPANPSNNASGSAQAGVAGQTGTVG
jgi:hypothetical protein